MKDLEFISPRLKMSLVQITDLQNIHELHSLPETDQYNTMGIPADLNETKKVVESWVKGNQENPIGYYVLKIQGLSDGNFLGSFGLKLWPAKNRRAEVWYKIHPQHWGNGYATEALNRILDFCFDELDLHRIQAGCAVDNIGSIKVLEKAGLIREGRGRQLLPLKTGWSDNFEYSILETDNRLSH